MSMSNGFQSPASPDPGPDMRSLAEGLMLAGLQMGLYAEWEAEETVELERRGWERSEEGGGEARSSLNGESSLEKITSTTVILFTTKTMIMLT